MRKILTWLPIAVLLILMCSTSAHAGKWSDYPDVGASTLNFNTASTDSLLALDADSAGAKIYQYMLDDLITDLVASVLLANDEIDASSELLAIMDDETGTGSLVFATSPTFITPILGVAAATTLNTGPGAYELYAMNQDVEDDDDVTFGSVTTAAASAARVSFKDDDAPGADKDVGNIQIDYIDGGDGSENADMIFRITQGGSEDVVVLRFDEDDDRWETDKAIAITGLLSGGIVTKVVTGAYTIGTTNAAEALGGVLYVTSSAVVTAPALAAGQSWTVITVGTPTVSMKASSGNLIILDGVTLNDGDKATNTDTTGDMIVCTYYDGTGWYCASGSPDGDHWTDTGA